MRFSNLLSQWAVTWLSNGVRTCTIYLDMVCFKLFVEHTPAVWPLCHRMSCINNVYWAVLKSGVHFLGTYHCCYLLLLCVTTSKTCMMNIFDDKTKIGEQSLDVCVYDYWTFLWYIDQFEIYDKMCICTYRNKIKF
jgi:hypothetical protein